MFHHQLINLKMQISLISLIFMILIELVSRGIIFQQFPLQEKRNFLYYPLHYLYYLFYYYVDFLIYLRIFNYTNYVIILVDYWFKDFMSYIFLWGLNYCLKKYYYLTYLENLNDFIILVFKNYFWMNYF